MQKFSKLEHYTRAVERKMREDPEKHVKWFIKIMSFCESLALAQTYRLLFIGNPIISSFGLFAAVGVVVALMLYLERMLKTLAGLYGLEKYSKWRGMITFPLPLALCFYMLENMFVMHYVPFASELVDAGAVLMAVTGIALYTTEYCCERYATTPANSQQEEPNLNGQERGDD